MACNFPQQIFNQNLNLEVSVNEGYSGGSNVM